MDYKIKVSNFISKYNILAIVRRKSMKKALKKKSISLFCGNCMGGMIYHDLGLEFKSPTINLMMLQPQFSKFMLNLNKYINEPLKFIEQENSVCPIAQYDDGIKIYFTHYDNKEIAEKKWFDRINRIDYDNMFVVLCERDGLCYEDMVELGKLNVKGLVIFTAKEYDLPYTLQIKKYKDQEAVGNMLSRTIWNDSREYEKYFNFVKWFNEAKGADYDIKPFIKK